MAFPLLGNAIWIDLVNTEPASPGGGRTDLLDSPAAAAAWTRATGLLSSAEASKLDGASLAVLRALRAQLAGAAESILAGRAPSSRVVKTVNTIFTNTPSVPVLARTDEGWRLNERPARHGIDAVVARLALDFARTLADGSATRLRRCERHDCVMLFLDTSKNGSRRWCSMETCGNREKAAARRARERSEGPPRHRARAPRDEARATRR